MKISCKRTTSWKLKILFFFGTSNPSFTPPASSGVRVSRGSRVRVLSLKKTDLTFQFFFFVRTFLAVIILFLSLFIFNYSLAHLFLISSQYFRSFLFCAESAHSLSLSIFLSLPRFSLLGEEKKKATSNWDEKNWELNEKFFFYIKNTINHSQDFLIISQNSEIFLLLFLLF